MATLQKQQQQQQHNHADKIQDSKEAPPSFLSSINKETQDDRKHSTMDHQMEGMAFQSLTPNLPVSPPHSPTLKVDDNDVSTHAPVISSRDFPVAYDTTAPTHYESYESNQPQPQSQQQQQQEQVKQQQKQQQQQQQSEQRKLKLADFHLLRTLGTGSFGRVHLVQSQVNQLYYAMKVLNKEVVVRSKQIEHTVNERNVLMSVDYPFLIKLWGTFQDAANLYMVQEYVAGGEIFNLLRRSEKFDEDAARFYASEVLLSIAYLHSNDIIYRDLKPENLLLDNEGHIKITDFGFAKHVPDITWTLCGTPDYLAPEIIESKGYGKSVDYWSLGILIYEMLAGYPPFYDDSQFRLYEKIVRCKPTYPDHFSEEAKDLLSHLLTTDLTRRYGNLKRGYMDLVDHPWFASVDFTVVANRRATPPFVPTIKNSGDTSNFDTYEESKVTYGVDQPDRYGRYFKNF
ncbi:kinase-like domain-containing protein [Absidia repens]|uniref:cAMP-dependent protein kinase n=1 Tax=Absidia repens TaxID=90262 RepID=A0A1X2IEL8_9FUNG|nr:kinase-like domain-containing protein [Absidia repens]